MVVVVVMSVVSEEEQSRFAATQAMERPSCIARCLRCCVVSCFVLVFRHWACLLVSRFRGRVLGCMGPGVGHQGVLDFGRKM